MKILITDNDLDTRYLLRRCLEAAGHVVVECLNRAAFDFEKKDADMVVAAFHTVVSFDHVRASGLPTILATGTPNVAHNYRLVKPFTMDSLLRLVREIENVEASIYEKRLVAQKI